MKIFLFLFAALFAFATPATADFPDKDITLIVPWSAGGGTDTIARALAKHGKKHLGVNVNGLRITATFESKFSSFKR